MHIHSVFGIGVFHFSLFPKKEGEGEGPLLFTPSGQVERKKDLYNHSLRMTVIVTMVMMVMPLEHDESET